MRRYPRKPDSVDCRGSMPTKETFQRDCAGARLLSAQAKSHRGKSKFLQLGGDRTQLVVLCAVSSIYACAPQCVWGFALRIRRERLTADAMKTVATAHAPVIALAHVVWLPAFSHAARPQRPWQTQTMYAGLRSRGRIIASAPRDLTQTCAPPCGQSKRPHILRQHRQCTLACPGLQSGPQRRRDTMQAWTDQRGHDA